VFRKSEGKTPLGKSRWGCENIITLNLREITWEGVDWMHLAQDRDQWGGSCEHGRELSGSIKGGEFLG
jgi:hypothetical protein